MNIVQIIGLALVIAPIALLILWKLLRDLPDAIIDTFRNGTKEDKVLMIFALITMVGMIVTVVGMIVTVIGSVMCK